jgi:hypothetical protein
MSGALLFNVQTQRTEWVPANKIAPALASGNYKSAGGVTEEVAPGVTTTADEAVLAPSLMTGGRAVSVADQALEQSTARERAKYDGLFQEVLTGVEGVADGLTFGLSRVQESDEAKMRREVNPDAGFAGELAGAVVPFAVSGGAGGLAGAALRATPAGYAARAGYHASRLVRGAGKGSKVLAGAAEGAVSGAVSAAGHTAAQVLQGNPTEYADALIMEAGLGALVGGAAGGLAKAGKIVNQRINQRISARAIKESNPLLDVNSAAAVGLRGEIKGAVDELAGARASAAERIKMLQELSPGLEAPPWLAEKIGERVALQQAAESAHKKVIKAFGGKELDDDALKMVLGRARPKDVLKAAKALDDYARAVSELDAAVRPAVKPAAERAAREFDNAMTQAVEPGTVMRPMPETPVVPNEVGGGTVVHRPQDPTKVINRAPLKLDETAATVGPPAVPPGPPPDLTMLPKSTAKPVQVSPVAERITKHLETLQEQTGLQISAMDAMAVASATGLDLDSIPAVGPVADGLLKLWLLGRVAGVMAKGSGQKAVSRGIVERAVEGGAGNVMAAGGRKVAGPFGAGAAYVFGARAVRDAAGAASTAGRAAERAAASAAAFLGKGSRYAIPAVSAVAWGDKKPGNFEERAAEIRNAAGNPGAVEHQVRTVMGTNLPPELIERMVNRAVEIAKNLAAKLPKQRQDYPLLPPQPPDPVEAQAFKEYDWATAHPDEAIERAITGNLSEAMVEALKQNWPDRLNQLLKDIMSQPEHLQNLPTERQVALSRLVGYPLVPEADPHYTQFQQQLYLTRREELANQQASNQSTAAIKSGTTPTPGQAYSAGPAMR